MKFRRINKYALILGFILHFLFPGRTAAKDYWSGEVRTRESYLYGRIEIRMKSAEASGVTSTLFTYNVNNSTYNEIDVEIMGRYNNEVSYNTFVPDKSGNPFRQVLNFNPHRSFHVHAIEWTPDYVAWYVDGFEVYRQSDLRMKTLNLPQAIMMNFWPPNSADWAGVLSPDKLPLYAYYDWIKFYKYDPSAEGGFTFQWQDDFNSFDQNRWIASNSTFGSNLADFKASNVVCKDGYLILCMKKQGDSGYSGGEIKDLDADAPYMVHAKASDNNISLFFSEPIDSITAETASNYVIPGLTVKSAELQLDRRTVHINVEGLQAGVSYNLIVRGIKDIASPANTMALKQIIVKFLPVLPLKVSLGGVSSGGFLPGQIWDSYRDFGYTGGTVITSTQDIAAPADKEIYKTALEDITSFKARIPNGKYNLTLMMAEMKYSEAAKRTFDVYCNGKLILQDVDIYKRAGLNTACEVTVPDITVNGEMLELYFIDKTDKPVVCGIKIEKLATGVSSEEKYIPDEFSLLNYPNPFNPSTRIFYSIPKDSFVSIKIYDLLGNEVSSLLNERQLKGKHDIAYNGGGLTSGVYFCRIQAGQLAKTLKIVMLR